MLRVSLPLAMRLLVALVSVAALALPLAGCLGYSEAEQGLGGQSTTSGGIGYFSRSDQWNPAASPREAFPFENPTGTAYVSFSGQVAFGRVSYLVLDAEGEEVWGVQLIGPSQVSRSGMTQAGEPGTWTVVREAIASSGQVSISITSA